MTRERDRKTQILSQTFYISVTDDDVVVQVRVSRAHHELLLLQEGGLRDHADGAAPLAPGVQAPDVPGLLRDQGLQTEAQ